MKTFETEKHNIPEGATGYREQGQYIEWFSGGEGDWRLIGSNVPSLEMCDALIPVIPIPQQEVEWKNGDDCEIDMAEGVRRYIFGCECPNNQNTCIVFTRDGSGHMVMPIERLIKPESPEEKEKRERLEAAYDLYCDLAYVNGATSFEVFKTDAHLVKFWLSIVDKTNYRK